MTARTLARRIGGLVALALIVIGTRHLLGPLLSSVALTGAGLWFGVRAWARWESRWDTPRPVVVPDVIYPRPTPSSSERHVVFARALAAVTAAYAAECEQEAGQP